MEDDKYVILKLVKKQAADIDEALILQYFSEEPQSSDPRNHCIALLDALKIPNDHLHAIVVLPVLRPYDNPEFDTIGEGLDFLRQVMQVDSVSLSGSHVQVAESHSQGLCFLHEHRVAHRFVIPSYFLASSILTSR